MVYDSVYFDATEESFFVDKDNKLYIRGTIRNNGGQIINYIDTNIKRNIKKEEN